MRRRGASTRLGVAVLVYNYDAQGGMERQAARLAEGLAARGVRVRVVSTYVPPARRPRREVRRGVEIVRVPLRWWTFEGTPRLFEARAAFELLRRRHEIDAIYAVHHKCGSHAARIAPVLGVPVLVKFACAGEHGDFASIEREPDARRLRAAIREARTFLCLSSEIEREAKAAGLDPERFVRVTNGVDRRRFSPEGARAELPESTVLFVGRLDRQKRVDVLLRAFAELVRRVPEARLALAGEGPLEDELRSLARSLELDGRATFLGRRDDVPALLRSARAFVLPSEAEGTSNALLEALSVGTPVVASEIAANQELVRDERDALLVPAGDPAALARALERILEDRALAARLSASGRELVAREHDLDRIVERHHALLAQAAREARAAEPPRAPALVLAGLALEACTVTVRSLCPRAFARFARIFGRERGA
jgi:glycosyltransferase involved in cell wall biosynthesis